MSEIEEKELEYELKIIEGSMPLLKKAVNKELASFHKQTAFLIAEIRRLTAELKLQQGAWVAQTEREKMACEQAGITFGGCDTVHDLADVVESLRMDKESLTAEVERLKREGTVQIEVSGDGIVMTGSAARQIGPTTYVMTATQFSGEAAEE